MEGRVDLRGLSYDISLLDVQELNEQLAAGELDISKASFHAALHLSDAYGVIRAGSALGFGVGPLLLAAPGRAHPQPDSLVLCPGAETTATLLFRCLYPQVKNVKQILFSDIMPALQAGDADFGVVIHEGRFTYGDAGLEFVEDLGTAWEKLSGGPVPLGGILARKSLGNDVHTRFCDTLRDSIRYAQSHRGEAFDTMHQYAQELDESVIWSHVDLYVNEHTLDIGEVGSRAILEMDRLARAAGLTSESHQPLSLLG